MKDQATDKRSAIIAGALILSAIFLVVFGFLLSRTETCPDGWWIWDRLACLEPNALGDTFAGAFAPVAFVWLVAAVMLQRNELKAQRQELRETREVSVLQVAEARKNVELIGEQTAILKRQSEKEIKEEADRGINALLVLFDKTMLISVSEFVVRDLNSPPSEDGWGNDMEEFRTSGFQGPYPDTREDRCREMINQISYVHYELEHLWSVNSRIEYESADKLLAALEILRKIVAEYPKASLPMQGMLDFIGVENGLRVGDNLLAWVTAHGKMVIST